jgi:plastocyanin
LAAACTRITALAGITVLALAATGCGDGGDAGADLPPEVTVVATVEHLRVLDNTFRPGRLDVVAGTTVEWTNGGRNDHNIVPVDTFGWGVEVDDFAPQDVYRHRFTAPGVYAYYCSLHGTATKGMGGTIVVSG